MHVYAWPNFSADIIQYNGTTFRLGDFKYIADTAGDAAGGPHTIGGVTNFPGYCGQDALIAVIRAAIKTAANTTYSVTLTDDQVTILGLN